MAAVDSGVETESESLNEDSNSLSNPPTPKVVAPQEEEALYGVRFVVLLLTFLFIKFLISFLLLIPTGEAKVISGGQQPGAECRTTSWALFRESQTLPNFRAGL